MQRRDFLKTAAALSAPLFVPSHVFASNGQPGANDRVKVGFAGAGRRARCLIDEEDFPGGQIVAVADCFTRLCDEAIGKITRKHPDWKPAKYNDIRQMLDKEKLDAVFVETTCHARVWCMMHALAAGVDVYGEKPLTLTVAEGRVLVDAARKHNRILQTGTQQRSMPINAYCSKLVREGAIGKVKEAIVYNFAGPSAWKGQAEGQPPQDLNWDLWCNQIELYPYHPALLNDWSVYEQCDGGGQTWGVSGWGTHALDQVQCALGTDNTGPIEIQLEEKGHNGWPKVTLKYANGTLVKVAGSRHTWEDLGAIFHGEKGNIEINRGRARANPKELLNGAPPDTVCGPLETTPHIKNFLDCVKSRQKPNADAEAGHRATTLCHLVNICRKLGRSLQWNPDVERFVGDDEADKMLSRPRRKGYELPKIS